MIGLPTAEHRVKETAMSRKTHIATTNTIDLWPRRRRTHAGWQAEPETRHAEDRIPRLAVVRPAAKTSLTPGTVVWAHIPFEETAGPNLRPPLASHPSGRGAPGCPAAPP